MDGLPRIRNGKVDMGAYEFQSMKFYWMNFNAWRVYYGRDDSTGMYDKWLAGLDPLDANAAFYATIEMCGNKPHVGWSPDLGKLRGYTVMGKNDLSAPNWDDIVPKDMLSISARFFKVRVGLPNP